MINYNYIRQIQMMCAMIRRNALIVFIGKENKVYASLKEMSDQVAPAQSELTHLFGIPFQKVDDIIQVDLVGACNKHDDILLVHNDRILHLTKERLKDFLEPKKPPQIFIDEYIPNPNTISWKR